MAKNIEVTVITNPEMGWDCVVNVIEGNEEEAIAYMKEEGYEDTDVLVFSEMTVYR